MGREKVSNIIPTPWNYITYVALNCSRAMEFAFNDAFIKVIKTIVMFVMIVVWNVLMEIVRAVRGDDLYQPVVSQTMDEYS